MFVHVYVLHVQSKLVFVGAVPVVVLKSETVPSGTSWSVLGSIAQSLEPQNEKTKDNQPRGREEACPVYHGMSSRDQMLTNRPESLIEEPDMISIILVATSSGVRSSA